MPLNPALLPTLILLAGLSTSAASVAWAGPCTGDHQPVCALGADGVRADFPNACEARHKGASLLHAGSCEAPGSVPSMCSHLYKPVCGTDPTSHAARTYPNLCSAEQADAAVRGDGACPTASKGGR